MLNIQEIMDTLILYHKDPVKYQGYDEVFYPELSAWLCEDESRAKDFLQKCTDDDLAIAAWAFEDLADTFGLPFVEWLTEFCSSKPPNEHIKEELNYARKENSLEPIQ